MTSTILFFGLSQNLDLIKYFKRFNNKVIIIDNKKKKNIIYSDLKNIKKTFNKIKKKKITHSITDQGDISLNAYGIISKKLKLNAIPYSVIKKFSDKLICRKSLFEEKKLRKHLPKFFKIDKNFKKLLRIKKKSEYIIKPRNSQGSREIFKFRDQYKLKKKYKKLDYKNYIIEDYILGQDMSVEGFVEKKKFYLLGISKKRKFKNSFVDKELIYTDVKKRLSKRLLKICSLISETLGLTKGLFHAEFKYTKNNKIILIEVACRGAGSDVTNIILKVIKNFDYKEFLYSLCFNLDYNFKYDAKKRLLKNCLLGWYEFKDSKVKKINLQKALYKKFLIDIKLKKNYKNKNLSKINDTSDRYLKYIIIGKNQKELMKNKKILLNSIDVKYF